jgi:hypothetical protein
MRLHDDVVSQSWQRQKNCAEVMVAIWALADNGEIEIDFGYSAHVRLASLVCLKRHRKLKQKGQQAARQKPALPVVLDVRQ